MGLASLPAGPCAESKAKVEAEVVPARRGGQLLLRAEVLAAYGEAVADALAEAGQMLGDGIGADVNAIGDLGVGEAVDASLGHGYR